MVSILVNEMKVLQILFILFCTFNTVFSQTQADINSQVKRALLMEMQQTADDTIVNAGQNISASLLSFRATRGMNQVQLYWALKKDRNLLVSEIEYCTELPNWRKIGRLLVTGVLDFNEYAFNHDTPRTGTNYYRIKFIDKDSANVYSDVKSIKFSGEEGVILHADPVSDRLVLTDVPPGEILRAQVQNTSGGLMMDLKAITTNQINLRLLSSGVYNVIVTKRNGTVDKHRIVLRK